MFAKVALMKCLQLDKVGSWDVDRSGAFLCPDQCQGVVSVTRQGSTLNICN